MNASELTLNISLANLLAANQVQSQDDIVTVARFYMTDLKISFKEALEKISNVINQFNEAQNQLLSA